MQLLKDILKPLKKLGLVDGKQGMVILAIAALLVLLGGLFVVWRKKKAAGAEEGGETAGTAAVARAPKVPKPPPKRFVQVWQRFLGGLPGAYRRSISRFQPFVVLGTAGSGKSALISRYTDWRRQANQFLSSESEDPNLQVYLSSHAVVLEIPADVLHDTRSHVRSALLRLYRRVCKGRKPIAVIVLNLQNLQTLSPDGIRNLADLIRGKLNLVSETVRAAPELRIAISHADCVPGFEVFMRFALREGISASFFGDIDSFENRDGVAQALEDAWADFDKIAPLALTRLSADDYLQLVDFLREAPAYLAPLSTFIASLCANDPVSHTPQLERVYLSHPTQGDPEQENPFRVQNVDDEQLPNPLARHRWYAVAAASVLLAYLGAGFVYQRNLWQPARAALMQYSTELGQDRPALRRAIRTFRDRQLTDAVVRYFPNFFAHIDDEIDDSLTLTIRKHAILPGLERSLNSPWSTRQSLYFLGLLSATKTNELGTLILRESAHWATATDLDESLIKDYVRSASAHDTRLPSSTPMGIGQNAAAPALDSSSASAPSGEQRSAVVEKTTTGALRDGANVPAQAPMVQRQSLSFLTDSFKPRPVDASNDPQPWAMFFMRLQRAFTQGPISETELLELQDEASSLEQTLDAIQRFRYAQSLLPQLEEVYGPDLRAMYAPFRHETHAPQMFGSTVADVSRVLQLVRTGGLSSASGHLTRLSDLCAQLSLTLTSSAASTTEAVTVRVQEQVFSFSEREWLAMMQKIQAKRLILDFIRNANKREDSIFFAGDEKSLPSLLNSRKENSFLFTGKSGLPARYTRAAFDRSIRPVLMELATMRDTLPLQPAELSLLEDFVLDEVEAYARAYANALDDYYFAFGVNADSADALQVLVKETLRPGSPFGTLLRTVQINSQLDLEADEIRYFEPLKQALAHYGPLQKVLQEQQDGYREISTYHSILEQMLVALREGALANPVAAPTSDGAAPPTSEKAKSPADSTAATQSSGAEQRLTDLLKPAGRLALSMYRQEPGSYLSMVQGWLDSAGIRDELAAPFLAPVLVLYNLGLDDIHNVVADVWDHQIVAELQKAITKFPFDLNADDDIAVSTLENLFHPKTGTFQSLRRRLLEPALVTKSNPSFRAVQTPPGMLETLMHVEKLSAMLWDEEGRPKKLRLRVSSVPFSAATSKKGVMTLAFLSTGSSSLFNFNQQPTVTALELDWTQAQRAQLGIELTSPVSGEKTYPNPIFGKTSPWSVLHLLQKGERTGDVVRWIFQVGKEATETASIRFTLHDDLLGAFRLPLAGAHSDEPSLTEPAVPTTTATLSLE